MKKLQDILYGVTIDKIIGSTALKIDSIDFDSRKITKGALFIAQKGAVVDGHDYIHQAIEKGAIAIICEELPSVCVDGIVYVVTSDASGALGIMASNFYGNPSEQMVLVGVTGT